MASDELKPFFVPPTEAARLLGGVRKQKIWDLARDGTLVMVKDGRRNLVEMKSLEALADKMLRTRPRWPDLQPLEEAPTNPRKAKPSPTDVE
jgi:hypothetical protein